MIYIIVVISLLLSVVLVTSRSSFGTVGERMGHKDFEFQEIPHLKEYPNTRKYTVKIM